MIGLGTWITFNVGPDPVARNASAQVVCAFFEAGGRLIDSSPMYGSSQPTIGHALSQLGKPATLFSAEKVWVGDAARGAAQMEASLAHWGVPRFDLMQVHNLLAWREHLPRLLDMKAGATPSWRTSCARSPLAWIFLWQRFALINLALAMGVRRRA